MLGRSLVKIDRVAIVLLMGEVAVVIVAVLHFAQNATGAIFDALFNDTTNEVVLLNDVMIVVVGNSQAPESVVAIADDVVALPFFDAAVSVIVLIGGGVAHGVNLLDEEITDIPFLDRRERRAIGSIEGSH